MTVPGNSATSLIPALLPDQATRLISITFWTEEKTSLTYIPFYHNFHVTVYYNLKEMAKKLTSVGIESSEKLMEVGAKDAFLRLKQKYPNVCLVHLYALEGAIQDTEFNGLSENKKKELKEFSDFLKR